MASSQVDIASSNPFGCILRDHNRHDGCRESSVRTPQTSFQSNNLKDLVRTRVRTRVSDNLKNNTNATTNDNIDSWIKNQDKERNKDDALCKAIPKQLNEVVDRWASRRAPAEEVTEIVAPPPSSPPSLISSPSSSPEKPKSPNRGAAASSLVQIWEARLGRSAAPSMASNNSGRCESPPSYNDNASFNEETSPHSETLGELETHRMNPDEPTSLQSQESSFGAQQTIENPRVADIIRRFVTVSGRNGNKIANKDHEKSNMNEPPLLKERDQNRDHDCSISSTNYSEQKSSLKGNEHSPQGGRLFVHGGAHSTTNDDSKGSDLGEQKRFANISHCPRIRGRQAFKDLLLLLERDRKKELDNLQERKPVSRFTHKGRIQSLLKLKILQRGFALQNQWRPYPGSTQPHHSSHGSTSVNWREKINAATEKINRAKTDLASSSICQVTSDSKLNNSPISGEKNNHCESKQRTEEEQQAQSKNQTAFQSESSASCVANQTRAEDVGDEKSITSSARYQYADVTIIPAKDVRADETSVASNATYQDVIISSLQLHQSASSSSLCATVEFPVEDHVREEPSETIFQDANGGGADSVGVPESVESCYHWYQEWTQLEGDHEDEDDQNQDETQKGEEEEEGYEWFLGVSRPRSYWEDLRQSWYREVMETDSTNAEIRQLLERRTVSNFLTTSDFQDRMNNMMMTHLEEQNHRLSEEEEDHSAMGSLETVRRFLSSYLQQQSQSRLLNGNCAGEEAEDGGEEEHEEQEIQEEEQPEVDEEEEEEEEDDEEMFMRRQERMEEVMSNCLQVSSQDLEEESDADEEVEDEEEGDVIDENEYVREDHDDGIVEGDSDGSPTSAWHHSVTHMPSPLMMRSWSCRYNRPNNDREIPTFIHPHNALSTRAHYRDNWQQFASINRLSMEMEMINDLRAQMKELYQGMSELRRSISSCVDMQVKLQESIKQEISSVRAERNKSDEKAPRKGYCCICYDMKVDSLLYRCGHMCTCLNCAHELQMGSGKCPMCRAPIVDVVRAYSDS